MRIRFMILFFLISPAKIFAEDFWQTNGPYGEDISSLAINSSGHVFAGDGSKIFCSTDNGESWIEVKSELKGPVSALAINSNGYIYAGTACPSSPFPDEENGGVYRSTDNGGSWTLVNNGLTDNTMITSLAINSNGDVFTGTYGGGVFRSTDNGGSWTHVSNGLANTIILSLAINSSGDIFAGTYGGGVYRSSNNGENWIQINNGLTNNNVSSLAIDSSRYIFAGTHGGGVFRSTNNGGSWTQVNNGLTNTNLWSLAVNSKGHVFAGTAGGIYRSTDNGASWIQFNNGLKIMTIFSLAINLSGYAFLGTANSGVFQSVQSTLTCIYSLSSTSVAYTSSGGTGSVSVTASAGDCAWTATSNDAWITITSGSPGSGNGSVDYSVSANSGLNSRVGTMTIAEKTFTVVQFDSTTTIMIVSAGWNLVSVPRVHTNDSASVLFPDKVGSMFEYNTSTRSYDPAPTLACGKGYWVPYGSPGIVSITGSVPGPLTDTVAQAGWTLVGCHEESLPLSSPIFSNGAYKLGSVYRYDASQKQYVATTVINPGEAVWINVNKACTITIP